VNIDVRLGIRDWYFVISLSLTPSSRQQLVLTDLEVLVDSVSYLGAAIVIGVICIFVIRWLLVQAESRGRHASGEEIARMQERNVGLEASEQRLAGFATQVEDQRVELERLRRDHALAEQVLGERNKRIESLEEADAHRQLYCDAELTKAKDALKGAQHSFDGGRERSSQEIADYRETLAKREADLESSERRIVTYESDLAKVNAELTLLRHDFQGGSTELARLRQANETGGKSLQEQREQIEKLNDQRALADGQAMDLNQKLGEAREQVGRLGADVMHLEIRAQRAEATVSQRDGKLAEQQGLFEQSLADQEKVAQKQQRIGELEHERDELRDRLERSGKELARAQGELSAERLQTEEKLTLLTAAREQLSDQFKALASDILRQNTQEFAEKNQQRLGDMLNPLKTQLTVFQERVERVHDDESKDRAGLREQVNNLYQLNQTLSGDARDLTKALKGEARVQGDWGEMILERVLELSGLREGEGYSAQKSHVTEDGNQLRPDVIVHLPDQKSLIVDAKVSLKAYESYCSAENEAQRDQHLKQHLDSIRMHIRGLSEKNYPALPNANSIAFVVMFVPLEPAFALAMSKESGIWQDAWKRNVMLVSPSTLMFVVRTVAHLWQQESQTRNSKEIARQGAAIYDKLAGFLEDMEKLGQMMGRATDSYESAIRKLSSGKGNVIQQAEKLRRFGVHPNKAFPDRYQTMLAIEGGESDVNYVPIESEAPFRPQ